MLTPTIGDDTLIGDDGEDVVSALAGNDYVVGNGGQDTISGDDGNDLLFGGNDIDFIYGGNDADTINGGDDQDEVHGGEGDDVFIVSGEDKADNVFGDGGIDSLDLSAIVVDVGYVIDLSSGLYYDDTNGGGLANAHNISGVENVIGTGAVDVLTGDFLDNALSGGGGDDTLTGGEGIDDLRGGQGNDVYFADATDTLTELQSEGIDTVHVDTSLTLGANFENLILDGIAAADATGNTGNNRLTGNDADNVLNGAGGTDTLQGNGGNDTYITDGNDSLTEAVDAGIDSVLSSATLVLAANFENLTLTGTAAINGTGNSGDNTLVGNGKANVLDGRGGSDTMSGGTGGDRYVTDGGDLLIEEADQGIDTVLSSVTLTLGANLENLVLTGSTAINGNGNALANTLTGNSAANRLSGGEGADTLIGGAGDDIYLADGSDRITEAANAGIDTVQSSDTVTLDSNVENLVLGGAAAINGTGNATTNRLIGNAAANVLNGGIGSDTMIGRAGDDTYITDGGDRMTEAANEGTDTVQSSVTLTLGANLEQLLLTGTAAINGTGNGATNTLTGNAVTNVLDGGGGIDTMIGGGGSDTYITDGGDTITEAANKGTDTVQSSVSLTLGENLEKLILDGTAAINGTGNAANNSLTGNAAVNLLDGGGGSDTMIGGAGNDTYITDGSDKIIEAADAGTDTVRSSATITLGANVEKLILTGTTAIDGTGNRLANTLIGNDKDNFLFGGSQNDKIDGGIGRDVLFGGAGTDRLTGGANGDVFVFDNASTAANLDTITDFAKADTIQLNDSVFKALTAGLLAGSAFVINTNGQAGDSTDHVIYESDSGKLWYDRDGTGVAEHVQIAKLDPGLALTSADFFVI